MKKKRYMAKGIPRMQNKGYSQAGASYHKRATKGFQADSGSPRQDIDENNYTLRQRARILYMASPVAASAIMTNRTNVVGMGLQLRSRIDREALGWSIDQAEAWQKNVEREFRLWAGNKRNCDATGVNNFYGLQQLALISWLLSGDCFGLFKWYDQTDLNPYSLRIHLIEADRIATPNTLPTKGSVLIPMFSTAGKTDSGNNIYDGVEVNDQGQIVAYHIRNNYPYEMDTGKITEWTRIPAYGADTGMPNIVHVMNSERPDQYRGVSYLAPVIEQLLQLRRYTESELIAAVIESYFTTFIKSEASQTAMPYNPVGGEIPDQSIASNQNDASNDYELGPGTLNVMKPGESVDFADPKRPTNGFDAFVNSICMQMGSALEIPVDLLLKKFNASYSASRAALLEAWKAFRMRRSWFADDFCQPIYEEWLSEAIALGRVPAPGFLTDPILRNAYCRADWIGPSQGMLDPTKEIQAEITACEKGISTYEASTIKLNGGSWDANVDILKRENEKLKEIGGTGNAIDPNGNGTAGSGTAANGEQ